VTVRLPGLESDAVPIDRRRIVLVRWQTKDSVPLEYRVNDLDMEVDVGEKIRIPAPMLQLSPNQYELLQPKEREHLDELVAKMGELTGRAFDYWLRTLRWKSKIGYIGEPSVEHPGYNRGGAVLKDRTNGHRFWLESVRISAQMSKVISPAGMERDSTSLIGREEGANLV
jgi:hypothetical protein